VRPASSPIAAPAPPALGFTALAGLFFFIVILKLGDPVVIPTDTLTPDTLTDVIFGVWPNSWGIYLFLPMLVGGLALIRWKGVRVSWPLALPLAWLLWQFVSATHTVDATLTNATLSHFTACVVLFYLGYFGMRDVGWPWPLLLGFSLAFCWIIHSGFEQHFGGLEATREQVHKAYGANWAQMAHDNPDFVKRIESNRIFATFVYPNALAGGLLLLLPVSLAFLWQLTPKVSTRVRIVFVGVLGGCGLAALYWSGSKAGWLIALVMALLALIYSSLPRKFKMGLIAAIVILGLTAFVIHNTRYFERGATSVAARFDYWKAALQTIRAHPLLGSGPGTFSRPYAQLKEPQSEMARLTHNDYLEQGSDSGLIGMALYCFFIFLTIFRVFQRKFLGNWAKAPWFAALTLGLLGICLQSFVEYHLYIPALAWPAFFLFGWVWQEK
jgi:hypothetical protein